MGHEHCTMRKFLFYKKPKIEIYFHLFMYNSILFPFLSIFQYNYSHENWFELDSIAINELNFQSTIL